MLVRIVDMMPRLVLDDGVSRFVQLRFCDVVVSQGRNLSRMRSVYVVNDH